MKQEEQAIEDIKNWALRIMVDAYAKAIIPQVIKHFEKEVKIVMHIRNQYRRAGKLDTFRVKQIKRGCCR